MSKSDQTRKGYANRITVIKPNSCIKHWATLLSLCLCVCVCLQKVCLPAASYPWDKNMGGAIIPDTAYNIEMLDKAYNALSNI